MTAQLSPLASVRVDFDFSDPCYVLKLAALNARRRGDAAVLAALSNNSLKLFACGAGDLQHVADMTGHTSRINDVCMPSEAQPELAVSASDDGTVRCWDLRSHSECERFECNGAELASCCSAQHVVAAGAEGRVVFWDRRTRKRLAELSDTHMDAVSVMHFHPLHQHTFVSGSEDGLVAVFDLSAGINDDDAFRAAVNMSNAPAELGFYGPHGGKLWCTSATETLHTWDWADAAAEPEADFENPCSGPPSATPADIQHVLDARERLTGVAKAHATQFGRVDYLLGCHEHDDRLHVLAGSQRGAVAAFPSVMASTQDSDAPVALLTDAHTEPVRTALWLENVIITGGEDARAIVWGDPSVIEREFDSVAVCDGFVTRGSIAHHQRRNPY